MLNMEYLTETRMLSQSNSSFLANISTPSKNLTSLADIVAICNQKADLSFRIPVLSAVITLAFPANAILLYVLLRNRKNLSSSEVLGLNFAILGVIYTLYLPFDMTYFTYNRTGLPLRIANCFGVLPYVGCPLLLTSLCLERFVAVLYPVLFMKLGRWEYRAACSAIIWIFTCIMFAMMFIFSMASLLVFLSAIIIILFLTMVACLLGIVWALCQKGPGDAKSGEQVSSPMKKKAIKHIMSVLVPSFIIYCPMMAMVPIIITSTFITSVGTNMVACYFFLSMSALSSCGVCLGPMFYVNRVKKTLCGGNNQRETTAE